MVYYRISGFSDRGSRDLNFVDPDNFFRLPDPGSDLVGLDQFLDFWISGFSDRGSRDLNFVDLDKFFGFFLIFFLKFSDFLENFGFFEKKSRQGKGYSLFFLKNSTKSSKKIAKNRKFVAVP